MNLQEFHQIAHDNISDDPFDRVPPEMKVIIKKPENTTTNKIFFDVHSHCFTYRNVPSGFPGLGIAPPKKVLKGVAKVVKGLGSILSIGGLRKRTYWSFYSKGRFLRQTIEKDTADEVLMAQFNDYNRGFEKKNRKPHIIMTPLMMDMQWGIKGSPKEDFYGQLLTLSNLRNKRQHHKVLLPFVGMDPRNPNLLEDFLAVFTDMDKRINRTNKPELSNVYPFFGVKLYPSLGYFPSDPKLMEIFKVCALKNIPVTSHCGSGSTRYNKSRFVTGERFVLDSAGELVKENFRFKAKPLFKKGRKIANIFNAPDNWLPVIKAFPKLKINMAHFGSDLEWDDYRGHKKNTHVHQALAIISKNNNVFADISYACSYDRNLRKVKEWYTTEKIPEAQKNILVNKVLFGSDYYLTLRKKSLTTIVEGLYEELQEENIINQICVSNPKSFLFSKT